MTGRLIQAARRLPTDTCGSVVVETAFVAPVLILLAIGSFEVSNMVSRQHELQNGISEATAVALAANMGAETNTVQLETMLENSLGKDADITITKLFRCNNDTALVANADTCGFIGNGNVDPSQNNGRGNDTAAVVSTYLRIELRDSYTPVWSRIGVAKTINYSVNRTVQLS